MSPHYCHFDGLGSVVALSDAAGNVVETYAYDVYGQSRPAGPVTGNPYRFTARHWDGETGLYYYRARYYNPVIGRFLQTDPIGYADGINWYLYCGNNPIVFIDPLGLGSRLAGGGFLGTVMGAAQAVYGWADSINLGTRAMGGLRAAGGVGPVVLGYAFGMATLETVAGPMAGAAVAGHGVDDAQAGLRTVWRGEYVDSWTSTAIQGLGVSRETANYVEALGTISVTGAMGYANIVRAGATAVTPKPVAPRNAHLAGQRHPTTGIPFNAQGYPDFSGVAIRTVKIRQMGNYTTDITAANRAAGLSKIPNGYTWHHHQDGTTMQLVPTLIHRATGHTGGMATGGR